MGWLWVALMVAGGALQWWSMVVTVRANPGERIPLAGRPPRDPGRAVGLRCVGVGVGIYGMLSMITALSLGPWISAALGAGLMAVFGVGPASAVALRHNRRIAAARSA